MGLVHTRQKWLTGPRDRQTMVAVRGHVGFGRVSSDGHVEVDVTPAAVV